MSSDLAVSEGLAVGALAVGALAVTGSIATDHLMTFPGRFADQLVADKLHAVSLSFLVDTLDIRPGGVAPNICVGLAALGIRPLLVGAAGADFAPHSSRLADRGVDTSGVHISPSLHTARFLCTTDADGNQIASFFSGAMSQARAIVLAPLAARVGGLDLVLIGADDPEAMLAHTDECRAQGYPFAADPSQQAARMSGEDMRRLISGAAYLFTNEYEAALIEQKTGWSPAEILGRVGVRVTTLGARGARVETRDAAPLHVSCPKEDARVDPTGVGDAFRAGFLAGRTWGLGVERSAQLGCMLATVVVETTGPQEYEVDRARFLERFGAMYGYAARGEVEPWLAVGSWRA